MWGQSWQNIYDIVVPFPEEKQIDVTERLQKKAYTPLKMFHVSGIIAAFFFLIFAKTVVMD
jgi:peptidyl-dipeptidase A